MSILVELEKYELSLGAAVAHRRNKVVGGNEGNHQAAMVGNDDAAANHQIGAWGEEALGKAGGIYVPHHYDVYDKVADVPPFCVRTRRIGSDQSMIVRPNDKRSACMFLVIADPPQFEVVGWRWVIDVQETKTYRADPGGRRPAYFVPREDVVEVHSGNDILKLSLAIRAGKLEPGDYPDW